MERYRKEISRMDSLKKAQKSGHLEARNRDNSEIINSTDMVKLNGQMVEKKKDGSLIMS